MSITHMYAVQRRAVNGSHSSEEDWIQSLDVSCRMQSETMALKLEAHSGPPSSRQRTQDVRQARRLELDSHTQAAWAQFSDWQHATSMQKVQLTPQTFLLSISWQYAGYNIKIRV